MIVRLHVLCEDLHDPKVDLIRPQPALHVQALIGADMGADGWVEPGEAAQDFRDFAGRRIFGHAEADGAIEGFLSQICQGFIMQIGDANRIVIEPFTRISEQGATGAAGQKGAIQCLFQPFNFMAYGGLGEAELLGGTRHAAMGADGAQCAHTVDVQSFRHAMRST